MSAPPIRSGAFKGTRGATVAAEVVVETDVATLGPDEPLSLQAKGNAAATATMSGNEYMLRGRRTIRAA